MKLIQALAVLALMFGGIIGLTDAAAAAPLAGVQALNPADGTGLVIPVGNNKGGKKGNKGGNQNAGGNGGHGGHGGHGGRNAAAIAAGIGLLGGMIAAGQAQHEDVVDDDFDDDAPRYHRPHCRYGTYIDHRGMRHCRP